MKLGLGFDPSSFFFPFSPLLDLRLGFLESDPPFSPSSIPCLVLILGIRVKVLGFGFRLSFPIRI